MKRTLIALFALGSLAMADTITTTLTTGISITKAGETQIVSALNEAGTDFVGTATLNSLGVGSSFQNWSGSQNVPSITFDVTVNDLYGAAAIDWDNAESVTLNSFSYIGNGNGWCEDEGRSITVALGEQSKTVLMDAAGVRSGAVLTVSDLGFTLTKDSVLTITLLPASGSANMSLATADIYSKVTGTTVAWSGVPDETTVSSLNMNTNWSKEAPLVALSVTVVPEPATATLSLLALAGLAARRRRH